MLSGKWDVLYAVLLSNLAGILLYAASGLTAWKKRMKKHGLVLYAEWRGKPKLSVLYSVLDDFAKPSFAVMLYPDYIL